MSVTVAESPMQVIIDENGVTVVSVGIQGPEGGAGEGGGATDHGALTGLGDDDHTQYHNDTRGDARYYQKAAVDTALSGKANSSHTHAISDVTGLQTSLDAKQPLATVLTNTTASFTAAQETKLAGIATGATANSSDATLLNRTNHTGEQAISTVTGLQTALDDRVKGNVRITVSATAPSTPAENDLWIDIS